MTTLKRGIFNLVAKCTSKKAAASILVKSGSRQWYMEPDALIQFHLKQYPDAKIVNKEEIVSAVFSAFYEKTAVSHIIPNADIPHSQSYLPSFKCINRLVFFNFFGRNYGIRDPILYRLIHLQEGQPLFVRNFVLPADGVKSVVLNDLFPEIVNVPGTFALQAFHPRMKTIGNQLRFFGLFQDNIQGTLSGVHSMPLPKDYVVGMTKPSLRSFAPKVANTFFHTCQENGIPMIGDMESVKANKDVEEGAQLLPMRLNVEMMSAGVISVKCEFCGAAYEFDEPALEALFA